MNSIVYYSFIPICILLITWLVLELLERKFYIKWHYKNHIYLFGSIQTALIIIVFVILGLTI